MVVQYKKSDWWFSFFLFGSLSSSLPFFPIPSFFTGRISYFSVARLAAPWDEEKKSSSFPEGSSSLRSRSRTSFLVPRADRSDSLVSGDARSTMIWTGVSGGGGESNSGHIKVGGKLVLQLSEKIGLTRFQWRCGEVTPGNAMGGKEVENREGRERRRQIGKKWYREGGEERERGKISSLKIGMVWGKILGVCVFIFIYIYI